MKKSFTYACVFEYENDIISVFFPDFDEAYTDGNNMEEALKNAQEVLTLTLRSRIKDNENIPLPTELNKIKLENGQYTALVTIYAEEKVEYIKKTLTIPKDLNKKAENAKINFSQLLQVALNEKLSDINYSKQP